MPGDFIVAIVVAAGIPSAITGFCFWCVQQKIAKRDKEQEEMEKAKEENELLLIKLAGASLSLGKQQRRQSKGFLMRIAMVICTPHWNMQGT